MEKRDTDMKSGGETTTTLGYLAAVEGGGTTFVVSVARFERSPDAGPRSPPPSSSHPSSSSEDDVVFLDRYTALTILHTETVPSSSPGGPDETLRRCAEILRRRRPARGYSALGIATFGPVGLDPTDEGTYGKILRGSPKRDWRGVDVVTPLLDGCAGGGGGEEAVPPPPHRIETDVNAPALAEFAMWRSSVYGAGAGAAGEKGKVKIPSSLAYVTVGTGVGVGLVMNGEAVHGMMHPEGGHVAVSPLVGDRFGGGGGYSWGTARSPYGGVNTVEGLASSVALTERLERERTDGGAGTGAAGDDVEKRDALRSLPDDHHIWDHASNALANLCVTLALLTSVERIVLGGGVMRRTVLYDTVRKKTGEILNGYLDLPQFTTDDGLRGYICESVWGDRAGLVGAFALALGALKKNEEEGGMGSGSSHAPEMEGRGVDAMQGEGEEEENKMTRADFGALANAEEERKKLRRQSFVHGFVAATAMGVIVLALLNRGGRR